MKGEIIAVGTELLLGNIVNSNAQYLSQKLADLGIDVYYHVVVGDNFNRAVETVKKAFERSDLVVTTGGLGPTDDDLTKEAVAEALGLELVAHEESINRIENFFNKIDRPMPDSNRKQGYIPVGSTVLENDNGTAPGVAVEKDGKTVIMLPGPPKELVPMFEDKVLPYLRKKTKSIIQSRMLRIVGVGESMVQEMLRELFENQTNPTIAPYAKEGEVHLRITAKTGSETEGQYLINEMSEKVKAILKENIYGYDDESLESCVLKLLLQRNLTISIAESCTGGLIASRLTEVPGASGSFMNGIITYSNESKMKLLNVKEETLVRHGAVSSQTAGEMADGIRRESGTDIGLSITGIAGPDGGSEEKPVGLCFIGIATKNGVETFKHVFLGNRNKIRYNAATRALDIVRRAVL